MREKRLSKGKFGGIIVVEKREKDEKNAYFTVQMQKLREEIRRAGEIALR